MQSVFYTGLLLFVTDVSGVITNPPSNAVAKVGQQAIFSCTSDTTLQNWILTTKREDLGTAAGEIIAINCVVRPGFTTHYDVDRPGGNNNRCNLIVKDTTMQQAGIYTCTDFASGPSAMLNVIDPSPFVTVNNTNDAITAVENDIVVIECVLNYNGTMPPAPTLRPYFYWTNSCGQNVLSSYDSTTDYTAVSRLTVTAGRQDIMPYTCHVYFQLLPLSNTGYASNTPTVSSSATSQIITVPSPYSSTDASSKSTTTGTIATSSATTESMPMPIPITNSDQAIAAAIAMGILFCISLVANIILLVILIRKRGPQLSKRTEHTPQPVILNNSEAPIPSAYEELRRADENSLQPATYEKLGFESPSYVTHVGETGATCNNFHIFLCHTFIFGTTYNNFIPCLSFISQLLKQAIVVVTPTKHELRIAC